MSSHPRPATDGLLFSAERWTPADAELWARWRGSLSADQRAEALWPLQAVLSGLVAFRHLENHPLSAAATDFRPHLHAVRVSYGWALDLVARLRGEATPGRRLHCVDEPLGEPDASLRSLERSLRDAVSVSERLLGLPLVDAGAFQASCDLFLRDLSRNEFFRPPDTLEFSNIADLVRPDGLTPELELWQSQAAKMAILIAFLTLLRDHRFLGIADRQIGEVDGIYRAHMILAAVRRELRMLTRFLLVQGVETFADELETRLLSLDAQHITGARTEISRASQYLKELRESVESLAMEIHSKSRSALDDALPDLDSAQGFALPAERMRSGIREVRVTLKEAARQLHALGRPVRQEQKSERVRKSLQQDVWAFRFILRAFIAKASVATVDVDAWIDTESLEFVGEFLRHFRVFAPRLTRSTDYPRLGPLMRTVGALHHREAIDTGKLDQAAEECALFLEHLDRSWDQVPHSVIAPFDKERAAAELRAYLSAARDRSAAERAAAGAFGWIDPQRAEAS